MIRFRATTGDGRTIIGLGLSDRNIELLRKDKVIEIKGETVDLQGLEIMIFWGRTEYEMTEALARHIGPDTVLNRDVLPPDHGR